MFTIKAIFWTTIVAMLLPRLPMLPIDNPVPNDIESFRQQIEPRLNQMRFEFAAARREA